MIDALTQVAMQNRLAEGERLLWTGAPTQGVMLRPSDGFAIPFGLVWLAFALFWEYSAWSGRAPALFVAWGLPFIGIGLYFVVGRFWFDAWRRARTSYAITDRRVLILRASTAKSLNLRTLSDVTFTERRNGGGTIVLGPAPTQRWGAAPPGFPGYQAPPSLELATDARSVFDILTRAQQAA